MKKVLLSLALIFGFAANALAANCSGLPYTFVNGQVADATQVNSNFSSLLSCANNNLAKAGANSDITSLSALSTPLSVAQGGTGLSSVGSSGNILVSNGTTLSLGSFGNGLQYTSNVLSLLVGDGLTFSGSTLTTNIGSGLAYNSGVIEVTLVPTPQGRLTLISGTPVMTSDTTAATSIYYTPYNGNSYPWYDGTSWTSRTFSELTLALDSNSGHTGYQSASHNFDLCLYNDGGTDRLVSLAAWTNSSTRSIAISQLNGIYTNTNSVTGKYDATSATLTIPAHECTYVGTVYTSADGQTQWVANPAAASGGGNAQLLLWNLYNRVAVSAASFDNKSSWTYTTATWRSMDNSTSNRVSAVCGLNLDIVTAKTLQSASNTGDGVAAFGGIGLNSTSAPATGAVAWNSHGDLDGQPKAIQPSWSGFAGQGFNYFQALEYSVASGTQTWYGNNGGTNPFTAGIMFTAYM